MFGGSASQTSPRQEYGLHLINPERRMFPVEHLVAIRANGAQVGPGVYRAASRSRRQWIQVVDVDEAGTDTAVLLFKIKATHCADRAKDLDALPPCNWISLNATNLNTNS